MYPQHYKFTLKPLPYRYDALEPYIDTLTMQLHHDRHLKTYIDNLNDALKNYPKYHNWDLKRLIEYANWLPHDIQLKVKRNAGGVYNHIFYFNNMAPNGERGDVSRQLETALEETFGGFSEFCKTFKQEALNVFGSGYAWLVVTKKGDLKIIKTANQDTPLVLGMEPVICIDVWEHAYYLKHYNKRGDYVDDWFNVLNLDFASSAYTNSINNSCL